jgi:hypothetical protein
MLPLLPEKHARLNETILGLGALLLSEFGEAETADELWEKVRRMKSKKTLPDRVSFDDVVLTLAFLYAVKAISREKEGGLKLCG